MELDSRQMFEYLSVSSLLFPADLFVPGTSLYKPDQNGKESHRANARWPWWSLWNPKTPHSLQTWIGQMESPGASPGDWPINLDCFISPRPAALEVRALVDDRLRRCLTFLLLPFPPEKATHMWSGEKSEPIFSSLWWTKLGLLMAWPGQGPGERTCDS
jgi:hypothetical protein